MIGTRPLIGTSSVKETSNRHAVKLSDTQLRLAVTLLADEASKLASLYEDRYVSRPQGLALTCFEEKKDISDQLETAQRYGYLATSMEYFKETRLSLLPMGAEHEIFVDECAYQCLIEIIKGHSYSLDTLSKSTNLFDHLSEAVDGLIARNKIIKASHAFVPKELPSLLFRTLLMDDVKKKDIYDFLPHSPFACDVARKINAFKMTVLFLDFRSYNLVQKDRGRKPTFALCFPNRIYVDACLGKEKSALVLTHEGAHGVQWHQHHAIQKYGSTRQFNSLHEAHAMSFEYIASSEFLMAGANPTLIHQSLYGLEAATVNLLMTDPIKFLEEVSQSDLVRSRWQLEETETRKAPYELFLEYAQSMKPLAVRWDHLPETVPDLSAERPLGISASYQPQLGGILKKTL